MPGKQRAQVLPAMQTPNNLGMGDQGLGDLYGIEVHGLEDLGLTRCCSCQRVRSGCLVAPAGR